MNNTQTTIDLRAVAYSQLWYVNQFGETSRKLPRNPTVHGRAIPDELAPAWQGFDGETMLERAKRLRLVDRWTAVGNYSFRNNHSMTFRGKKAKQKHKEYGAHIYEKKN